MGEKTKGFVFSKIEFFENKNSSLSLELFFSKIPNFFCKDFFKKRFLKKRLNERSNFFSTKKKSRKSKVFDFFRNLEISRKKKERDAEEAGR